MLFDNSLNDKRFRIDIRTENGYEEGCTRGAIQAGSRKRDPALFNSGPRERSPGPLSFLPCFPEGLRVAERRARRDGDRAESAARVKMSASIARETAFALSSRSRGEREAETRLTADPRFPGP